MMPLNKDLLEVQKLLYNPCLLKVKNVQVESEGKAYNACMFNLDTLKIIFRTAKITPKKSGQFVTFWKRSKNGPIEPFNETDQFDYYVICVRHENQFGQFVIPKSILVDQGIVSTAKKEGKRGFRVYPPWDKASSQQADKTQQWQLKYFLFIHEPVNIKAVKKIYQT